MNQWIKEIDNYKENKKYFSKEECKLIKAAIRQKLETTEKKVFNIIEYINSY
jgi:hypothetical protein